MKGEIYALPLVEVDTKDIGSTYTNVFTISRDRLISLVSMHITNHSNNPIYLSLDGVKDHDVIMPFASFLIEFPKDNRGFLKNYNYYVRASKSGPGSFFIATYCHDLGV